MQLQSYNLTGTMETWWDSSHKWAAAMGGYRAWWWGGGAALDPRALQGCVELCQGTGDEPADSLMVRITEQIRMGNAVASVCYQPPDQEEVLDFCGLLQTTEEASRAQALVLVPTLTTPVSGGGTTEQSTSDWRCFKSALVMTFRYHWSSSQQGEMP